MQNGALASHRGTVFGHPEPQPLQLCDMKPKGWRGGGGGILPKPIPPKDGDTGADKGGKGKKKAEEYGYRMFHFDLSWIRFKTYLSLSFASLTFPLKRGLEE